MSDTLGGDESFLVARNPAPRSSRSMSRITATSRDAGASMRTAPATAISRSTVGGTATATGWPLRTASICASPSLSWRASRSRTSVGTGACAPAAPRIADVQTSTAAMTRGTGTSDSGSASNCLRASRSTVICASVTRRGLRPRPVMDSVRIAETSARDTHLLSDGITHHGAKSVLVWLSVSSNARW